MNNKILKQNLKNNLKNNENYFNSEHFNFDWLAGLIDGDGCFLINKLGYASLEINVAAVDLKMLQYIQSYFKGSVKFRANYACVRYRLHKKSDLIRLIQCVNGRLRNSIRQQQFKRLCDHYGLDCKFAKNFTWDSAYVSGLMDSDGKVVLSVKKHYSPQNLIGTYGKIMRLTHACQMQLTLGITQKYESNVKFLKQPMNSKNEKPFGIISFDKSQNGYYTWYISNRYEINQLLIYFKTYPCRSVKNHRLNLIKVYYDLIDNKAHKSSCVLLQTQWHNFARLWFKYSI